MYIHQKTEWPQFRWNHEQILFPLAETRNLQGRLSGRMESIGFSRRNEALLNSLTTDIIKSNEIEGVYLDLEQVRSSVARRLGMDIAGLKPADRYVDGVVEMMMDAVQDFQEPLTAERLFSWHAALFPSGRSGTERITVGDWRNDAKGPMQVVSGPTGKEKVHFEAPEAGRLAFDMQRFLRWFNARYPSMEEGIEPVIKSGIAHFWFMTIHPFDDGNGRIARAIADMQLARAEMTSQRFYSMSAQIEKLKKDYYTVLEKTQKGSLDITEWLLWYVNCLNEAIQASDEMLSQVISKALFWKTHESLILNKRQHLMISKLLDDFHGKLTTSKWARTTHASQDTALRDIQDLIVKGLLEKEEGGGRSTSYALITEV